MQIRKYVGPMLLVFNRHKKYRIFNLNVNIFHPLTFNKV